MIGVHIYDEEEREWAAEFFELFKTPWEIFREGVRYPVLLTTHECPQNNGARVVLVYSSGPLGFDRENRLSIDSPRGGGILRDGNLILPVYGETVTFPRKGRVLLRVEGTDRPAAVAFRKGSQQICRIGYNLFREIRHLLTLGQPPQNASHPTLELHIALLRWWILRAGVQIMEIPPSPPGFDFMVCLTHDVDFAGIRKHLFDHTMAGFLYRALFGSAIDLLRGKAQWEKLVTNWKAALLLPAVYAGMAKDFWNQYEQYLQIENGLKSTFYLIPFKKRAGIGMSGPAPARRACRYDISDVEKWADRILSQNGEIGLHGLDAWKDARRGREELERIRRSVGSTEVGVRMHWLYFGPDSPTRLEEAGFLYDSTWGYNDAVGFRAGTGQVFRPPGARRLMELPLIIQDTALFYKGRMGLGEDEALERCKEVIVHFRRFGGALVINWHHRSLAPERLWGDFYRRLLNEIRRERVLFVTAREAVEWFQSRRSAGFEMVEHEGTKVRAVLHGNGKEGHPRLGLRLYKPDPLRVEADALHCTGVDVSPEENVSCG
jgi:hypothetical protein